MFDISIEWTGYDGTTPLHDETSARLLITLNDVVLTENRDPFAGSVRKDIHVSIYPLACWIAANWWRLHYEILSVKPNFAPSIDWRMSHELAAANAGYSWPTIMFATDREFMTIWAESSRSRSEDTVRYLNDLNSHQRVKMEHFSSTFRMVVETCLARLDLRNLGGSELHQLWDCIRNDEIDEHALQMRRIEAELGFDPEEAPEELITSVTILEEKWGTDALAELIPAFREQADREGNLSSLVALLDWNGPVGKPDLPSLPHRSSSSLPWQRGMADAKALRSAIGHDNFVMDDTRLTSMLGLTETQVAAWEGPRGQPAAAALPVSRGELRYVPRRRHPAGRRFEMARFVADCVGTNRRRKVIVDQLLASTDARTTRQQYQRAFAAELLCPLDGLTDFLSEDYSSDSLDDAASHFKVSQQVVENVLVNNGYLKGRHLREALPYDVAA